MSHISTFRANIHLNPVKEGNKDATWDILEEALETVAEEHGGRISDEITDFFGRKTQVDYALITPEFPHGIGVNVNPETGEVSFLYDKYGRYRQVIDALCEEVRQNYTAIAVSRALGSMNYSVELDESEETMGERRVVVRGVM